MASSPPLSATPPIFNTFVLAVLKVILPPSAPTVIFPAPKADSSFSLRLLTKLPISEIPSLRVISFVTPLNTTDILLLLFSALITVLPKSMALPAMLPVTEPDDAAFAAFAS